MELHLATGLQGQLHTETAGVLEARFANPLIYWELLEDPKAREAIFLVLLDRIRSPAGVGLQGRGLTLGDHEGISEKGRRRRAQLCSASLFRPSVTYDLILIAHIHNLS